MNRMHVVAAMAAGALLVSGCSSASDSDTTEGSDNSSAVAAADWLLGELGESDLLEVTSSWEGETTTRVDHGGSVDLVLGLSALGHAEGRAADITDAVAADLGSYVGADGEVYAGPSAKALLLAVDQGRDAGDFGGMDLRDRVEQTVTQRGAARGRIQDTSEWGDYANTLGQAYAAAALTRVESDVAQDATGFLLQQQCEEGFFRLDFSGPKAKDQSCDGADVSAEQAPDVTALVVLQLATITDRTPEVTEALANASDWLVGEQSDDGSFSDPENATNANTTGLAGWALRVLDAGDAADRAADWLGELQVPEDETGELADEAGAIAYDTTALEEGRTHSITDPLDRTQWVIAGVQAFPALAEDLAGRE